VLISACDPAMAKAIAGLRHFRQAALVPHQGKLS